MGIAERRERQKAEVRELILDAARQIAGQEGLAALTIRKIADAIEYAPGTIYLHFPNRDAIARELVIDGFMELVGYMAPAAQNADPLERLRSIGLAYAKFGVERPETYRTIFLQSPEISGALADLLKGHASDEEQDPGDQAFNLLANTVGELIENGTFRKIDPVVLAETIWAWLHGIVSLRISCSEEMLTDFDQSVHLAIDGIQRAFAP
jgi:AcrR family transcriptional regulator